MLEWSQRAFERGERPWEQPSWDLVLARLLVAGILGAAAAAVYAWTHRRDKTFNINFLTSLILLSILIAAVTQIIGENQARAFGLVGALAIVRFRTVVEDVRDTAFVMLAVILGMGVGAGYLILATTALAFSTLTAVVLQPRRPEPLDPEAWSLSLRVGVGQDPESLVQPTFAALLQQARLISTATARQGAAVESTWTIVFRPGCTPASLLAELNRVQGVQNVELRRANS